MSVTFGEPMYGQTAQLFGGAEASFGAGPAAVLAATDAIRWESADCGTPQKAIERNKEQTGNRGRKVSIPAAPEMAAVKILVPLLGSGALGTAPDYGAFLIACGLTETVNPATSVVYSRTLTPAQTISSWAALINRDGSKGLYYHGLIFEEGEIPEIGATYAKLSLAGKAARASKCVKCAVGTGGITDIALTLPLAARNGWVHLGANFVIKVTEGANSELMRVTAIDQTTTPPQATVTRNVDAAGAFAFTVAATITPYAPPTNTVTAMVPIAGGLGTFTINDGAGAVDRAFRKGSLKFKTGVTLLPRPALEQYAEGIEVGHYGDDAVLLTTGVTYTGGANGHDFLHDHAVRGTSIDVLLRIGSVATNQVKIDLNACQVRPPEPLSGDSGPQVATIVYEAFSADGADLIITFD